MNYSQCRGLTRKSILAIFIPIFLVGGYAIKRSIDHLQNRPVLLPQQMEMDGYVQKKVFVRDKVVEVYHPDGYALELVNQKISRPRMIYFHGDELFIGSQKGYVYRLYPPYDRATAIGQFRNYPHSVIVRGNELLIAFSDGIFRTPYSSDPDWKIDIDDMELLVALPQSANHSSRTLKQAPDGKLYVSMGYPKNCSDYYLHESYPPDERRGGIFVIDESGPEAKLVPFASGLRNPVGFDWHPDTGVMYASNNGPDHLGYDLPPDYFSKVTQGSFHGMPWYQFDGEKMFPDKCADIYEPPRPIEEASIPVAIFPPHNAPLDVLFINKSANAKEYYGDAVVALHGSWVKSTGTAFGDDSSLRHPKLALVKFENGEAKEVVDLLSGFQFADGSRWARPAGLAIGPDGDIYFTSDKEVQGLFRLKKVID